MGISIEQYRATIGRWSAGSMKRSLPSPSPIVIDWTDQGDVSNPDFQSQGPWKLHAVMLTFLMTLLLLIPSPSPEANLFAPSLKPCDSNISSCSNLLMSAMTKQTHDSLLLIGGIESHPGPTSDETNEKRATVIAELVCKADAQTVKDTLRLYKPAMTFSQLQKALNAALVDPLVETMSYLGIADAEKFNKPTIINNLIKKVQTLFPDMCAICSEEFVVKLEDTALLCCAICGQGIHSRCLARKIGIPEIDLLSLTPEEVWKKINPYDISTLNYLCGYCHSSQIPSPDEGLKKKTAKQRKEEKPPAARASHLSNANDWTDMDSDSQPAAATGTDSDSRRTVRQRHKTAYSQHSHDSSDADSESEIDPDSVLHVRLPPNKSAVRKPKEPLDKSNEGKKEKEKPVGPVCPFFRKGQCRHGISGKGCSKAHPSLCRKLMSHGTKGPRGCTNGKECERFHPKMCPSSISYSECLNDSCSLYHVKGTKRMNSQQHPPKEHHRRANPLNRQTGQQENKPLQPTVDIQEAFLEMFRNLQKELMVSIDQKVQESLSRNVPPAVPARRTTQCLECHHPQSTPALAPGVWHQHHRC